MTGRVGRTAVVVCAVVLGLLGGAAQSVSAATHGSDAGSSSGEPTRLRATVAELQSMLADARLPRGSMSRGRIKRLPHPGSTPDLGPSLRVRKAFYQVPLDLDHVQAWVKDHPSPGLPEAWTGHAGPVGDSPAKEFVGLTADDTATDSYVYPELDYTIIATRDGTATLWRMDAYAGWLDGKPQPDHHHATTALRLRTTSSCPKSDRDYSDVVNRSQPHLEHHFTRVGTATSALVCRYTGYTNPNREYHLYFDRLVTGHSAARLGTALSTISLAHLIDHPHWCNEFVGGQVTVIALAYPHGPDLDIWYDEGCTTFTNGHVLAGDADDKQPYYDAITRIQRTA